MTSAPRKRALYPIDRHQGKWIWIDGRQILNLASNDYLSLSWAPEYRDTLRDWDGPVGSGASRLLSGNDALIRRVERAWASWRGFGEALFFPSGYQLNSTLIPVLVSEGDLVVMDRLVHASIVDGVTRSGARFRRYPHNDLEALRRTLERERAKAKACWIITETVFSMEGDFAPMSKIVDLAREFDCRLYVDEAHSVGVWEIPSVKDADVLVGTFGKAIGLWGSYVCVGREVMDAIVNRCRGFIFSTGISPLLAGLVETFLGRILRRLDLRGFQARIARFRRELRSVEGARVLGESQIVPLILGEDETAVEFYAYALERGLFCPPIRPPTVPEGTSRVRLSLSAGMTDGDLEQVLSVVRDWYGVLRR